MSVCASKLVLNLHGCIDQTKVTRWEGSELTGGSIHSLRQRRSSRRLRKTSMRSTIGPKGDQPAFELTPEMREAIALQELRREGGVV